MASPHERAPASQPAQPNAGAPAGSTAYYRCTGPLHHRAQWHPLTSPPRHHAHSPLLTTSASIVYGITCAARLLPPRLTSAHPLVTSAKTTGVCQAARSQGLVCPCLPPANQHPASPPAHSQPAALLLPPPLLLPASGLPSSPRSHSPSLSNLYEHRAPGSMDPPR